MYGNGGRGGGGGGYRPGPPNEVAPWPFPNDAAPAMAPSTFQSMAQDKNVGWAKVPAYLPNLTLPMAEFIAIKPFDIIESMAGNAAGTAFTRTVNFPQPTVVFALNAGVTEDAGGNLPVGPSPLDQFTLQIIRTNGDQLQTAAALGGSICGTAQRPRLIGPTGWVQDRGSSLQITCTPLVANLRIDLCFVCAVIYGPASFTWNSIPANAG